MGKGTGNRQPAHYGGGAGGVPSQLPSTGGLGPQGANLGGLQPQLQDLRASIPPWLEQRMAGLPHMSQGRHGFIQGHDPGARPFRPEALPITTAAGLASTQASPVGHATSGSATGVSAPASVAAAQPSPTDANSPPQAAPDPQALIQALRRGR